MVQRYLWEPLVPAVPGSAVLLLIPFPVPDGVCPVGLLQGVLSFGFSPASTEVPRYPFFGSTARAFGAREVLPTEFLAQLLHLARFPCAQCLPAFQVCDCFLILHWPDVLLAAPHR